MVSRLSDEQLRALLSNLLMAEARVRGIPAISISVGGNQTAADGGVDASIVWEGDPEPGSWLPRRTIMFQCKAETMAGAALTKEMRPKGVARPIFAELAAVHGAYIVFSTDDPSSAAYDTRLSAMLRAVEGVPGNGNLLLDFYGADRIARWANEHLGVAIWALEQSGRPMGGWRPYGPWSAIDGVDRPYLFDETARAVVNGAEMDIRSAVAAMREQLALPGGTVRLVGISGMGKTRLAEALFDDRINPGSALPSSRAIYADLAQSLAIGPLVIAEELVLARADAVIVLDNAGVRIHAQIAQTVSRPGSAASLLSIDYDVGGERPTGTMIVSLGNNSETVLMAVLEQRCPTLTQAERYHLAEFAGGNARIALKVAEGSERGLDLSSLNDGELLDRLFQAGRQQIDPTARLAADAASLVYAFYIEPGDGQEAEHGVLAEVAGISREQFFRHVATFLDWGIVQQRGPQRAVMPPPLANMLALPFIRRSEPGWLLDRFSGSTPRLFASFARRLGQLHAEPAAVRLVQQLLAEGGMLGDPADLNDLGLRAFLRAAPAAPDAALCALARALSGPNSGRIAGGAPSERREIAHLLAFIAHDPSHFASAMEALMVLALYDHGDGPDSQMTEVFLERFWPVLSFTLASGTQRVAFIDRLIDDGDERIQSLGLEALDHMLDAGHFSSSLLLDFGARPRLTEWRPNGADYSSWVNGALERLTRVAINAPLHAQRARKIIAKHLREHIHRHPYQLIEAMRAVWDGGYWEDGWKAAAEVLHFDGTGLPEEVGAAARDLEHELRPKGLDQCFEAFVIGEPWRHYRPHGGDRAFTRNVGFLAEAVGTGIASSSTEVSPYIERCVRVRGYSSAWLFGRGLAKRAVELDGLWTTAYAVFAAAPDDGRNPEILSGILNGGARRSRRWVDERLDQIVSDPILSPHLVTLQRSVDLNTRSIERFSAALRAGDISAENFLSLMMGGITKPVPANVLADFLRELFNSDGGALVAVQVLHMRLYGDRTDGLEIDPTLVQLAREFLADERTFDADNQREDFDIAEIAKVAMRGPGGADAAAQACRALRRAEGEERISLRDFDQTCRVIMKAQPRTVLDEIVGSTANDYLVGRFFGGYVRDDDDLNEEKLALDEQTALEWVREDPSTRAPRLAKFVKYSAPTDSGAFTWSPIARSLMAATPTLLPVLQAFAARFWSGGGSGPISARFVRRRPLVAEFMEHSDPAVRAWARQTSGELEEWIRRWDDSDRERASRFE
jgi:hypothetical protein